MTLRGQWLNLLVVKRKGDREHTKEGVWKSGSRRLQCICGGIRFWKRQNTVTTHVDMIKITRKRESEKGTKVRRK